MDIRQAARLLLLDAAGRILLVQFENHGGRRWWGAPGGGVRAGETIEQALAREVVEELGLTDVASALPAFRRKVVFENLDGGLVHQVEQYFVARCASHDVPRDRLAELRAEGIVAVRWWTVEELAATTEQVFPDGLVAFLRTVHERGR